MDGARLLFSLPVCVCGLLGCVLLVAGRGDGQRSSTITSPERKLYKASTSESGDSDLIYEPTAITPPYLQLPVFQHQSTPAVSKELLSPGAGGGGVVPDALLNILIPEERAFQLTPINNNHGVELWCGYTKITVRIDQALLNFRSSATHFRFGTCPVSRADDSVLYFQYAPSECGSSLRVRK